LRVLDPLAMPIDDINDKSHKTNWKAAAIIQSVIYSQNKTQTYWQLHKSDFKKLGMCREPGLNNLGL